MKSLADKVLEELERLAPVEGPDRNGKYKTLCPFHEEARPSFYFHPEKGHKCFGCTAKGGVRVLAEHLGIKAGPLTVEQLAEAKGLPAEWLITNKLARNAQRGVEIPYLDLNSEQTAIRLRLNLCKLKTDERFLWEKGKPLLPYGLWLIENQKPSGYAIIVEGESDCWALWHGGFNAIGIPGARNWKAAWAKYFKGFDKLYIWLETDEAGCAFLTDISTDLPGVLVIQGPSGIKDASDLFISDPDGFKNSILQCMDDARAATDVLAEVASQYDSGWQGRCVCGRWKWDSQGIYTFNNKGEYYVILPLKIKPLQILVTPESRRFCNISMQAGGDVSELYLADSWVALRGADAAREVADYGIALTTKQVGILQELVGDLLNEGSLPSKSAYRNLGWYDDFLFTPGMNNAKYLPNPGMDWIKNYGAAKDADGNAKKAWQYILDMASDQAPALMAAMGAALAAPFLNKLPITEFISFMVHLHTLGTGTGKTTILEMAAATVGDPRRICTSWDATKVGLEQMLGPIRHLPVFLNELSDAKHGVPEDAVMMLAEEVGRRRGASGGGLRPTAEWRTIVLSTGNYPIAQGSAHHARRVLSVPVALPSEAFARECQEIAHDYYGQPLRWCAPFYTNDVIASIRELSVCYSRYYTKELIPIKPQTSLWALIEIGARMLLSAVGMDEQIAHTAILKVAEQSARRRRAEGVDYVTRILELVQEDMVKDPGAYGVSYMKSQRPLRGIAGRVLDEKEDGDPKVLAVLPGRLQELTKVANIPDLTGALSEARERGILQPSQDRQRLMKKVRINESPAWCYVFELPDGEGDVGTDVGTENEAVFPPCSHQFVFVPTVPT